MGHFDMPEIKCDGFEMPESAGCFHYVCDRCAFFCRCVRITDTGLGYLSTMSTLRSLYLRWCCQVTQQHIRTGTHTHTHTCKRTHAGPVPACVRLHVCYTRTWTVGSLQRHKKRVSKRVDVPFLSHSNQDEIKQHVKYM